MEMMSAMQLIVSNLKRVAIVDKEENKFSF